MDGEKQMAGISCINGGQELDGEKNGGHEWDSGQEVNGSAGAGDQ